jgi:two-component sensor histidine kinase
MLNLGNVDKAKFYITRGIELADKNGYKSTQSFLYPTLGKVSELEGNYEEALAHYRKGEKLKRRAHKKRLDILYPVGIISCKLNLNQKVSKSEIDSLLVLEKTTNDAYLRNKIRLQHLGYLAQNDVSLSEFDKQYSYLSTKLLDKGFLYILKDLHNTAYKYYTKKEEYKSAINSLNQFVEYENQLYSQRQNHRILDIEAKYNKEVDKRTILQLSESNETQANILRQRTIYLVSFGIGLVLISLLSFFLFKYYRKVRSQNTLISNSLKEKDFLLREIHHRVKNNLQVISSLLSLQARQIDDQHIQKAINEGRNRVRSMALIHQNLYQNESLSGVSVELYLSNLLKELFSTYNIDENKINLDLDIEEINLDVDTMVPFGLILNELVSNCLKHAFPGGREGNIKISLKDVDEVLNLSVVDNGVGIGNEIDFQESKTFGNRLIKAFTKKLNADLEVLNQEGTTINIKIRNYKRA